MISAIGISLVGAWIAFSFLFWRSLRAAGAADDRIFDLTFYGTLVGLVVARLAYVALHWSEFVDTPLKILAIWVAPGLSLYAFLIGLILTLVYLGRTYKIRVGQIMDTLALSLPLPMIMGEIGSFFSALEVGKEIRTGVRHPVQLYAVAFLALLSLCIVFLQRRAAAKKWPYGMVGMIFFLLFSTGMFLLELLKESSVYWVVTANQWILIGFFGESIGALYVRGGGRGQIRPLIRRIGGKIYAAIPKRGARRAPQAS